MANILFVKDTDVKRWSALSGNVDTDKYIQYMYIAQDIEIHSVLGTKLYEKLKTDIEADALSGNYVTLVTDWIAPALIHWAVAHYLPFGSITIGNSGVFRHQPENSVSLSSNEIDNLVDEERKLATYYTKRLDDYLCNNSSLFPEYYTNTKEDIYPSSNDNFASWVL